MAALKKIIPFGPWKRDANWYGDGYLLCARNVAPMVQGYRGGFLPADADSITIDLSGTTNRIAHAYASVKYLYATQYGAAKTGKIIRSTAVKNGGASVPFAFTDITISGGWTADPLGNIAQYGKYIVFAGLGLDPAGGGEALGTGFDSIQVYDDDAATGDTVNLIKTTAPTGSSHQTAEFAARFAAPYKNHMVLANCVMRAGYPGSNTMYAAGQKLDSMVWISMSDNIFRYASPTVHPEVRGSIPINLLDDGGPITGLIGGEQMYIFKEFSVYMLVGPPFDAVRISKDIGCVSPKSIVEVAGIVFFMSNYGPAMVQGNQVQLIQPEMFANGLRGTAYNTEMTNRWTDPVSSLAMVPSIVQTANDLTRMVGTYSDPLGAIVWMSEISKKMFIMQATPPYNMSFGDTVVSTTLPGDATAPDVTAYGISAVARSPGGVYYTDYGGWVNNFMFGQTTSDSTGVSRFSEVLSGFSGASTTYPMQFTTTMIPLHATEEGPMNCRVTGFRIIGEANGHILKYSVRTNRNWSLVSNIKGSTAGVGNGLEGNDGWVNTSEAVAGRFHSLSFTFVPDPYQIGEDPNADYYRQMPNILGVEIAYEAVPARSA